ncbi:hypothetical protein FBQ82_00800 [Anaerolineae bacterium CFX7]|nr:hypothetical protein [Anaerolineae bacterium CFX7]
MNASDVVQDPSVTTWSFDGVAEETIDAWTNLVRRYYPNLATPIARALTQRAMQGPYGFALFSISQGIHQFDETALREMTGSELQMLSALLQDLSEQTQRMLVQVNAVWHPD